MGLRFRKSVKLGLGFRLNFSSKGVGYSWGSKVYRVTKTADGKIRQTYSLPGTGLSYVTESGRGRSSGNRKSSSSGTGSYTGAKSYTGTEGLTGASHPTAKNIPDKKTMLQDLRTKGYEVKEFAAPKIASLRSAGYEKLLFKTRRARFLVWGCLIAGIVFFILAYNDIHANGFVCLCLLLWILALVFFLISRPSVQKKPDTSEKNNWNEFFKAWEGVSHSDDLEEITLSAKKEAGSGNQQFSELMDFVEMKANHKLPWYLRSKVKSTVFNMRKLRLAFLPGQMLLFNRMRTQMGVLDYKEIKFDFIDYVLPVNKKKIPKDAEVLQYVWEFTNPDGSPDRTVLYNRQYPIMRYGKITITSKTGLNVQFLCSNLKAAKNLQDVLKKNPVFQIT